MCVSDGNSLDMVCSGTEGRVSRLVGVGCIDRSRGHGRGPWAASVPAAERRMSTLGILGEGRLSPSCSLEHGCP